MAVSRKTTKRKGILAGGNWIIDQVKTIDVYPRAESLANILAENEGTGGSPYNILIDLAKLPAPFPLQAAGLVGADPNGKKILTDCRKHKITTSLLKTTSKHPTSYTDVMTVRSSGQRTFFHNRGANAVWDGGDIDFSKTRAKIFHVGYLLLLDALDSKHPKFGTKAAALLAKAQKAGLKTSVDVVSEDSDRFSKVVNPVLPYTDYCILNEIEAGKTTGFTIRRDDGSLDTVSLRHAAGSLLEKGIRECVVIHFPEGAFARTKRGEQCWQSSLKLPKNYITGSAGAGDAFCSGVLLGLHEDWPLAQSLETGICLAAASLSHPTCTGGITTLKAALALAKKYRKRPTPKTI